VFVLFCFSEKAQGNFTEEEEVEEGNQCVTQWLCSTMNPSHGFTPLTREEFKNCKKNARFHHSYFI
jgi:hypothetical protein